MFDVATMQMEMYLNAGLHADISHRMIELYLNMILFAYGCYVLKCVANSNVDFKA